VGCCRVVGDGGGGFGDGLRGWGCGGGGCLILGFDCEYFN